ncbi:zinc ribbon domain-containing protein [Methanobacterium petrolearium]|uniref:zinc ribbon domain-containing protein n=1 Tax=Methanobacterium petrolearium TaxID=710190 RepID=UPI001AE4FB0E|nr:zinc ribbon domain-containing protein [Methanobacterium petrolearium]MBP1947028.1 transcription elongation factor Elf1 [Methanobacterium petrolearium]BDZ71456.1 hypothetical protein GCM10025861_19730 [Methanobacterium petrolearium]
MGYLECDMCGGRYELENGESPDDFSDKCECGGNLKFFETYSPVDQINKKSTVEDIKKCPHCNFLNKATALFCRNCGKKMDKSLFTRLNDEINLFSVFIGLGVSCIVFIIGSFLFGSIVASASLDVSIYVSQVLIVMVFCGGTATGIVGCEDFKDGAINGLFLSLIGLVILGFVIGVMLFITMGIAAAMSSAFGSYSSTSASSLGTSTVTSDSWFLDFFFTIIKGMIILIMVFISGAVGGSFGVFLKNGLKNVTK